MPNHILLMSLNANTNLNKSFNLFFGYLLNLTGKSTAINLTFVSTGHEDNPMEQLILFAMRLKFKKHVNISKLSLTASDQSQEQLEHFLLTQDIVFINSGHTENMMEVWQAKGFTAALNHLKEKDLLPILAAVNDGALFPFEVGLSDCTKYYCRILPGFGWLKGSFCSHSNANGESFCMFDEDRKLNRREAFIRAVDLRKIPAGYALTDDSMLHIYGDHFLKVICSKVEARCDYIEQNFYNPGCLVNTLPARYLTDDNIQEVLRLILNETGLKNAASEDEEHTVKAGCFIM